VAYVMYTQVFSPDSATSHFNRAVDRVKADQRCIELLGNSNKIKAYGEPTWNKWARARPIAYVLAIPLPCRHAPEKSLCHSTTSIFIDPLDRSSIRKDQRGVEHLIMHFNVGTLHTLIMANANNAKVEGPLDKGVVNLHMIKGPSDRELVYKYLVLDVKGHQRIYLENADAASDSPGKSKSKFFGVSWR
jgi:import inner membrane translocase subunit TIM21